MTGVYHEFTSLDGLVEQFARLEYKPVVIHDSGFVVRRMQANPSASIAHLEADLAYPYLPSLLDYRRFFRRCSFALARRTETPSGLFDRSPVDSAVMWRASLVMMLG